MTWLDRMTEMEETADAGHTTMQRWYFGQRVRVVRVARQHWQVYDHRYSPPQCETFSGPSAVARVAAYLALWQEGRVA